MADDISLPLNAPDECGHCYAKITASNPLRSLPTWGGQLQESRKMFRDADIPTEDGCAQCVRLRSFLLALDWIKSPKVSGAPGEIAHDDILGTAEDVLQLLAEDVLSYRVVYGSADRSVQFVAA